VEIIVIKNFDTDTVTCTIRIN